MEALDYRRSQWLSKNYKIIKQIGEGTYGDVFLATKKDDQSQEEVAIKIVKNKDAEKSKLSSVQNEKQVLDKCKDCPFIVQIHDFFKDQTGSFFVLEYLAGGELFEIIQKRGHISEDSARFYASQVLLAMEYMHSQDIIYRDLKPENVLLDKNGYIKLTDFGLSELNVVAPTLTKLCGTPEYVSPEMLFQSGYGKGTDHWSLGVFIYEMITGHTPFQGNNQEEIFNKIKLGQVTYPISISPSLKSLLEGLLTVHPSRRLGSKGIDQIKKHSWFMKTNWEQLKKKSMKAPFKSLANQPHLVISHSNNMDIDLKQLKAQAPDPTVSPTLSLKNSP